MAADDDLLAFRWRLAETIAWCTPRLGLPRPVEALRTRSLLPTSLIEEYRDKPRFNFDSEPWIEHEPKLGAQFRADIQAIADNRARVLREERRYPAAPEQGLAGGRVLRYLPDGNLSDGAAALATGDYFDVDNVPP